MLPSGINRKTCNLQPKREIKRGPKRTIGGERKFDIEQLKERSFSPLYSNVEKDKLKPKGCRATKPKSKLNLNLKEFQK